ncbi:MAG TPA: GrpB family protein [Leptolyngbyaceae cyanobacterium]
MKVEVVPHDAAWRSKFADESNLITPALGDNLVMIHHIGSTSIPGIYAKPIIDILVEVKDITEVDQQNAAMTALGYEAMGEFVIPGRRYFRKHIASQRSHHVHIFAADSPEVERHLAFRDYMIAHPEYAQKYSELKRELAKLYPEDIYGYMDGKDGFIKEMERKALAWQGAKNQ